MAVLYITHFEAESEIEQSLDILESSRIDARRIFFHLRWRDIWKILQKEIEKSEDHYERAIYNDIATLLELKNLLPFYRFSELPTHLSPDILLHIPVYFKNPKRIRGFYGFTKPPEKMSLNLALGFPIFFHISKRHETLFKGFSKTPHDLNSHFYEKVYYGGYK